MPAINIVVEDDLSRAVLERLIKHFQKEPGMCFPKNKRSGCGYIDTKIKAFNEAAHLTPCIILRDLDQNTCAPLLIRQLLPVPRHPNLIIRIVVREIESWVMADRDNFALFAGIDKSKLPHDMDSILNPKEFLINLIRNSRKKQMRSVLLPKSGSTARVGPVYNSTLIDFILTGWDIENAIKHSRSLQKAYSAVKRI